jgi:hypothetical protein
MADVSQDLGSRIVQAARLAVAMHLAQSLSSVDSPGDGRTHAIGGAGPRGLTDEHSSRRRTTGERPRRSTPSSPLPTPPDRLGEAA